jgi:GTP-binding protein
MGLGKVEVFFTAWNPVEIPVPQQPRWIVLGKSNVGKSSFLNALVHPFKAFKVGSRPGVTVGVIGAFCQLGKSPKSRIELLDTPGYGFSVRKTEDKLRWGQLAQTLLNQKKSSKVPCFWLWLVDPLADFDQEEEQLLEWLEAQDFAIVFTKCDRINAGLKKESLKRWQSVLQASPREPFWVSSLKGEGFEEIFRFARHYVKGIP